MRVYLNAEDKGEWFFKLDDGHPLFPAGAFRAMGLVNLPEIATVRIDGMYYEALQQLQSRVSYRIDEKEAALYINVPADFFKKQLINRSFLNSPRGLEFVNSMSAYANYGLDYSREIDSGMNVFSVPLELVFHRGNLSGYSNFVYTNNADESRFVRLLSAVTRDDHASMTRLTLGDFPVFSGRDGGGGIFGGISFSRNFSINPYYSRYTGLLVNGTANTPSQVDYFLGDRLMFSETVSPGEFEVQNMTPPAGAHRTRMVITDVYGSEYVVDGAIYIASRLLEPGTHEFSYSAGFERQNFGLESGDYGKPAALGIHRTGINDQLTLGGRGELSADLVNIGGEASFQTASLGQMDVMLSVSMAESTTGYAASAGYQYVSSVFSISARARAVSRGYSNLNLRPESDKTRYEWHTGLGLNAARWGSLTVSYSARKLHSGVITSRATLYYSIQVGRIASLAARYTRISGDVNDEEFFLGLSRPFGAGRSGAIEYRKNSAISRISARLSKNRSLGPGLGYNLSVGLQDGTRDALLAAEYAGSAGVYSAGYRIVNGQASYRAGMFGSVSMIAGKLHLSRPIRDSFVLIKVDELADVDVRFNNQFAGQTNKSGELLIPNLNSYYGNRISVNDHDIPIDYELAGFEQVIATPFRGGGIVAFDARRLQAFTGRIFVSKEGDSQPAEYWGLRYQQGREPVQTVVGRSGEFYLENLPPGETQAEIFSGDKVCLFTFNPPNSREVLVNLGEITCELSN